MRYGISAMYRLFKLWLPVLLWMSLIFYLSSIPNLASGFGPEVDLSLRKIAHISEYAILMTLLTRALSRSLPKASFRRVIGCAFILTLFYAVSDEFHQLFVEGRDGTLQDIGIDTIGIAIIPLVLASSNKIAKKLATFLKKNDGRIRIHRIPL